MRPRLLDLFCGAGGAAMGYHRAGFDVVGVDIRPQPHYPFEFIQADALKVTLFVVDDHERLPWASPLFDAIHASPPCQAHSTIGKQVRVRGFKADDEHPDLVAGTRELLAGTGLPYVIENVPGAPLLNHVQLCGSWFGLDVRRHRLFETNWPLFSTPCSHHWQLPRFRSMDKRRLAHGEESRINSVVGVHGNCNYAGEGDLRKRAMGIDWMSQEELAQAIPPAYTELIGNQLMQHIRAAAA